MNVALGGRGYPIRTGRGLLPSLGGHAAALPDVSACLLVSDDRVAPLYADACAASLGAAGLRTALAVVPAGEGSKSREVLFGLYQRALDEGLDRRSLVVALGGGVVGDLAGYLAASYLRGIRFVQVPTTLLAMVDSSVGGKTGINLPGGKNLVGAFHQPSFVLQDLDTLSTLPPREYASGLAEVIKYGVIADAGLFGRLERDPDVLAGAGAAALPDLVARCGEIKAEVVADDERETTGRRAVLNFGHTLGHAVETAAGYGAYLHGEAVAVGMVYAARLSARAAGFPGEDAERLAALLRGAGLPVAAPGLRWAALRAAMASDKKAAGRVPRFVLVEALGRTRTGVELPEALLEEVWHVCGE